MHREFVEKLAYYLQFLLVLTFTLTLSSACPSDCSCKWKGGKQSVECLNRGLRTFPGPIDPGTQVLDLTGNSFETLPPDHFMRLGLINLQKIYLSKCRLSLISPRTFRGLSNLVDLDLSNNAMREVPSGAFPECQGLMRLILSGNPISHLQRHAFISLKSLTTLEISYAGIELIDKGAFDGLASLEWLKLNGNKLKRVSGLGSLPMGLKGIWLEENQWDCDCRLLELRLWLEERNVANSVEPRCLTPPRLTNSTIKDLTIDNFACLPQLSPTTMYQKIGEGKNVSLLCKVVSVPESTLEWWFNGLPVLNSSLNIFVETSNSNTVMSTLHLTLSSPSSSSQWLSQLNQNQATSHNNNNNPVDTHNYNSHVNNGDSINNHNNNYYGITNNNNNNNNNNNHNSNNNNNNMGIERKSELLILNATSEENGTFVCVARNPAGVATANFTLKVLTRQDLDSMGENTMNSLVNSYPNLLVVMVSTGGVVGVVILLVLLVLVLCKCGEWCGRGGRRRRRRGLRSGDSPHSDQRLKDNASTRSGKEGKEGTTGCGGKLNRHLSEASTLTTATKSNGSVFLLSTSSELGIGDSNPDLIEGVKRVEGDGHETSFTVSSNNFNNSSVYASPESSANPTSLDPFPPTAAYPVDYGLPKNLNVTALVRRSPSTYSSSANPPQLSIPPNYDLAKYPKEYISPTPLIQCGQHLYAGPPAQGHVMYGPPPPSAEYYPAYMVNVASDGNFIYSGAHTDYYMGIGVDIGGMGGHPYGMNTPIAMSSGGVGVSGGNGGSGGGGGGNVLLSTGANCTCAPIMEQSEEEKAAMDAETESMMSSTGTGDTMTMTAMSMNPGQSQTQCSQQHSNPHHVAGSNRMGEGGGGGDTSTMKRRGESGMVARLQRQLKSQINESPDEGYEDESAEGTEI